MKTEEVSTVSTPAAMAGPQAGPLSTPSMTLPEGIFPSLNSVHAADFIQPELPEIRIAPNRLFPTYPVTNTERFLGLALALATFGLISALVIFL